MKIEIGEDLVSSYLKHVEGCRVVQTNWKTSGRWKITEYDEIIAKDLFYKIKGSSVFFDIFGNNSFEQVLKQAEIDVLGINSTESTIIGVDVAFHSGGLNYKGSENSAKKVLMKIFRTILVMQTYFSEFDKFCSYFVAPKVNESSLKPILDLIEPANKVINDELISIDFISNNEFYSKIVDPVIDSVKTENDTSELFARSVKLMSLDKREEKELNYNYRKEVRKKDETKKYICNGMKIGQYVQYTFRKLFEENLITGAEIERLLKKEYSKKVFDQTYEILREPNKGIYGDDGRNRYYAREKFCGNYYLTSQWVERHWKLFKKWEDKIRESLGAT